jgi:hypothetical protein
MERFFYYFIATIGHPSSGAWLVAQVTFGGRWILCQHRGRANRTTDQIAFAVRANAAEDIFRAICAERAFERADPCVGTLRQQVAVTALAVRLELHHGLSSGFARTILL